MPGDGFTLAVRVGRKIDVSGLCDGLDDGIDVLLVFLYQRVAHVEIVAGVYCAFLRLQIADMTIGRDYFEAAAEIFLQSLGLGGGLYDQQTLGH